MDVKKLTLGMVGIMICAVMIGGALLPVINGVTATEAVFTNEGYYRMSEIDDTQSGSLFWSYETPTEITVNGEVYDIPENRYYSLLASNFSVRANGTICQMLTDSGTSAASLSNQGTLSIEYIDGTITGTMTPMSGSTVVFSETYTKLYVIDKNGDFVMKYADEPAYINGDSKLFGAGLSNFAGINDVFLNIEGSLNGGVTVTQISTRNPATYSTPTLDYTAVNNYDGLYLLDSIDFVGTYENQEEAISYNYFVVPYKVYVDIDNPIDSVSRSMIGVIPLVTIAGLLVSAIYIFINRK